MGNTLSPEQKNSITVVGGSAYPEQADDIAEAMGLAAESIELRQFPSGELYARFESSVRRKHVLAIQTGVSRPGFSVNDSLAQLELMIDAAKRADAERVTAVMPHFPYGRQDRKAKPREPISAAVVVRVLQALGANRLLSVDLHSPQTQAVFNGPFDHLTAEPMIRHELKTATADLAEGEVCVVAPDEGRAKEARSYARELDADICYLPKDRDRNDTSRIIRPDNVEGVSGRTCVLVDDMIDTAGTLVSAVDLLEKAGAHKIIAAATHGIFSGPALERLQQSAIDKLIVTDTVPQQLAQQALGERLKVLPVAPLIGRALLQVVTGGSVSEIFEGKNCK